MRTLMLAFLIAAALLALPAAAQAPAYIPPKTAWGDPDIQGQWPATARIPMQRPADLGTRAHLTDKELAERQDQFQKQANEDGEEFVKSDRVGIIC